VQQRAHKHAPVEEQRLHPGRVQFGVAKAAGRAHVLLEHTQRQHRHRGVKQIVRGNKERVVDRLKTMRRQSAGQQAQGPKAEHLRSAEVTLGQAS